MADQLASPQDLASLLQLDYDALTVDQQATMTMLVELATAKVQRAAGGQRIVEVTDTEVVDVTEPCDLYLPLSQFPVREVTAVVLDGAAITDFYLRRQMVWRAGGWMLSYDPPSQALVTYKHGFEAGSQWLQLGRDHALTLGRLGWGNPGGSSSEAIDDYRVTYAEADARMQMTDYMAAAIADAYGTSAYSIAQR